MDCRLALIHLMQSFLSFEWRFTEGSERLIDLWMKHRMTMEVFGLGVSLQGTTAKEEVRPTSLSF